jgi:hypothetical protein
LILFSLALTLPDYFRTEGPDVHLVNNVLPIRHLAKGLPYWEDPGNVLQDQGENNRGRTRLAAIVLVSCWLSLPTKVKSFE